MDGTLMDTSEGLRAGLTQAIQLAGLPPLAEEQIRYIYSAIAHQALARFYGLSQEEGRRVAGEGGRIGRRDRKKWWRPFTDR